jgi:hypothetical protein
MPGLRHLIRSTPLFRPLRLARLRRFARGTGHEDWATLLGADLPRLREHVRNAASGATDRVLIATGLGGHFAINVIDRMLAVALTERGAAVTVALCDGAVSACQMCEVNLFPNQNRFVAEGPARDICGYCFQPAAEAYGPLGIPVAPWAGTLKAEDIAAAEEAATTLAVADIEAYVRDGVPIGEHARAGALRFFARGDLEREQNGEAVLRRYFQAALLTAIAFERLLDQVRPTVVVAHHGIYVPQGIVAEVARRRRVRVVTWNPAYRTHCFLFSHDATYHHTMMDEPVEVWRDRPLSPAESETLDRYLRSRWEGANDWIRFHRNPDFALTKNAAALNLDPGRPIIVALTNVFWDAQLHYPANAFRNQKDWLVKTVRWFEAHPDLQLVIRVHPAELTGTPASRQFAADEIARVFPVLPDNVTLISPKNSASTYALCDMADCAIIYATKTGVELTSMGIPVIVAGEAWIRNKGITFDAESEDHYFAMLARLPFRERLPNETVARARAYAFHFFFRRMVPLPFITPVTGPRRFATGIGGLDDLAPGRWPGLDVICDGILRGTPFHILEEDALRGGYPAPDATS